MTATVELINTPMKADAGPTAASLAATVAFLPEGKPAGALQQMVQQVLREAHILAKLELPPAAHRVSFVQLRPPGAGLLPVIFAPHGEQCCQHGLNLLAWLQMHRQMGMHCRPLSGHPTHQVGHSLHMCQSSEL